MRARPVPTYLASSCAFPGAGIARRRVQTCDLTVVASSHQNGTDRKLTSLTKSANLLTIHLAIAATAPSSKLHASQTRHLAQEAGARGPILNHTGQFDLDAAVVKVRKSSTSALTVGADLQCMHVHQVQQIQQIQLNRTIIGLSWAQIWPGSTKAGTNPKTGIIASTVVSRVMSIHTALRTVQTWGRDCCDA
jgi:hypothetical protein